MNEAKCVFCGGAVTLRPWGAECTQCASVQALIRPTAEELAKFYAGFLATYHGGGRTRGAHKRQLQWAHAYLRAVRRQAVGQTLVDVGPANSPFPVLATDCGFAVSAIDFQKPDDLPSTVEFIPGSLNDSNPPTSKRFDVVTAWAVLEHCLHPLDAASMLVNLCKPGGFIAMTTPRIEELCSKYAAGHSPWLYPPEHLQVPTSRAVTAVFGRLGCSLVAEQRFEFSSFRWTLRYGASAAEVALGMLIRATARNTWLKLRDARATKSVGISLHVFRRGEDQLGTGSKFGRLIGNGSAPP